MNLKKYKKKDHPQWSKVRIDLTFKNYTQRCEQVIHNSIHNQYITRLNICQYILYFCYILYYYKCLFTISSRYSHPVDNFIKLYTFYYPLFYYLTSFKNFIRYIIKTPGIPNKQAIIKLHRLNVITMYGGTR